MSVATLESAPPMDPARLHPKEHGAYAILGMPLLAALLIGGVTAVGVLTILAAVAGFLANEPLMVAWGRRGQRARSATPTATRVLVTLLLIAGVSGSLALWLGTPGVQTALLGCAVFAALGFGLSAGGWQRTLTAQLVGIVGLTLPSVVVLLAGGIELRLALALSSAWMIGRVATTTAVRSVVARSKASLQRRVPFINDVILLLVASAAAIGMSTGIGEWITVSPLLLAAVALRLWPPAMKDIRNLGWRLVAVNVVSCVWMVAWYAAPFTAM